MEEKNMDFIVSEANQLLEIYKKRSIAKTNFLKELITLNNNFQGRSIFDSKLLLENSYSKQTIDKVISDLGYTLEYNGKKSIYDSFGFPQGQTSIIVISK